MAYTMQQIVDRARIPLNDADKDRYSDDDLLAFANEAVKVLRRERPDLFFGQYEALPADKALGDALPLDDEYAESVASYVTARAETVDDEHVNTGRARLFFELFNRGVGGAGNG
jgi:hypothetical protein